MTMHRTPRTSVSKAGSKKLVGDVTLSEGSGVTLTQSGQNIEIASTGAVAPYSPKLVETFNSNTATAAGDLVVVTSGSLAIKILDNSSSTIPNGIFGVCISKPTTTTAQVLFIGIVSGYSGLTIGQPVFVSTSGIPTNSIPSTGVVQQIGFALSSSSFFINLMAASVRG